jgi:hypothetical protein
MLAGRLLMAAGVALFSVGVVIGVVVDPPAEPAAFWGRAAIVLVGTVTGIGLYFFGMLCYLREKDRQGSARSGGSPGQGQ